jgi:hypothetical protein
MNLKLNYINYPEAGGAKKIQIYSSYIFMNKTGLPFNLVAHSWNGSHKEIAGNSLFAEDYTQPEPTPFRKLPDDHFPQMDLADCQFSISHMKRTRNPSCSFRCVTHLGPRLLALVHHQPTWWSRCPPRGIPNITLHSPTRLALAR